MILIRWRGEQLLVQSTAGYPGCKVVAKDVEMPPDDCSRWQRGKWVECDKMKAEAKAKRLARACAMFGEELLSEIAGEIEKRINQGRE